MKTALKVLLEACKVVLLPKALSSKHNFNCWCEATSCNNFSVGEIEFDNKIKAEKFSSC